MSPRSYADYRQVAKKKLPAFLFEYIDAGAYVETTAGRNVHDLAELQLRQRVLRDVSDIDVTSRILGQDVAMPVGLAPVGMAGMMARRGEVSAARAAQEHNVPFCLSSASCCSLEEVSQGAGGGLWYQLYMLRDRAYMAELLERARSAGYRVLVITLDTPRLGVRYRDFRAGISAASRPVRMMRMAGQIAPRPHWTWHVGVRGRPHTLGNMAAALPGAPLHNLMTWMQGNLEASATWSDIAWFRERWNGPIVLKGILDVEDARAAISVGADAIVVSNHGGRQLDGVRSTASALQAIAEQTSSSMELLVDGGVRSGLDVLRMLALGAKGVFVGRPWAFALAAQGQAGVQTFLNLLREELRVAMALTGVSRIGEIGREQLEPL